MPTGWANFAGDIHSYTTFTPIGKYMYARHAMDMIVCLFVLIIIYVFSQHICIYKVRIILCVSLMLRVIMVWDGMQTRAGMKL